LHSSALRFMITTMATVHEQLLAEITGTITSNSEDQRNRRIRALERLLSYPLKDVSHTVEVLSTVLKDSGAIGPESTLVAKYLTKATRSNGQALETLLRLISERHEGAISCGCWLLSVLRKKAQSRLGSVLANELLLRETVDHRTEAIAGTLQQLRHP